MKRREYLAVAGVAGTAGVAGGAGAWAVLGRGDGDGDGEDGGDDNDEPPDPSEVDGVDGVVFDGPATDNHEEIFPVNEGDEIVVEVEIDDEAPIEVSIRQMDLGERVVAEEVQGNGTVRATVTTAGEHRVFLGGAREGSANATITVID